MFAWCLILCQRGVKKESTARSGGMSNVIGTQRIGLVKTNAVSSQTELSPGARKYDNPFCAFQYRKQGYFGPVNWTFSRLASLLHLVWSDFTNKRFNFSTVHPWTRIADCAKCFPIYQMSTVKLSVNVQFCLNGENTSFSSFAFCFFRQIRLESELRLRESDEVFWDIWTEEIADFVHSVLKVSTTSINTSPSFRQSEFPILIFACITSIHLILFIERLFIY